MIFELHPIGVCDASSRGAPPLHYSTVPVFKGDVPSEPPTAYKKPPSTATATPNLLVLMEATRVHLFSLGSYLKEEECCHITTINRSGKHIWSTKWATCVNYLKNWRRYFTFRFGRVGLIPPHPLCMFELSWPIQMILILLAQLFSRWCNTGKWCKSGSRHSDWYLSTMLRHETPSCPPTAYR